MKKKSIKNKRHTRKNRNTNKNRFKNKIGGNSESALMLCHDYSTHKKYFFANKSGENFYAEDIFKIVDYVDPKALPGAIPKGNQFKNLEDIPPTKNYDKIFSLFCPIYTCISAPNIIDIYDGKISIQEVLQNCRLDVFQKLISSAVKLLSENGVLFIPITRKVGPKNRLHATDIDPQLLWEYLRDVLDIIGMNDISMGYIRTQRLKNEVFVFTGVFHRPTISFEDVPYHILIAKNDDAIHSLLE
jgi:hypothetical protein